MAIEVFLHRILVKREEQVDTDAVATKNEMSRLGLVIPEPVKKELDMKASRENASMDKGHIVSIGATAFKDYGIACPLSVGDYIAFARFAGKEVVDPETGDTLIVINDEDCVAKLVKGA